MRVRQPKPEDVHVLVSPESFRRDAVVLAQRAVENATLLARRAEGIERYLHQQPLPSVVALYDDFRNAVEAIDEARKVLTKQLEEWTRVKLPPRFKAEGVRTINLEGRGRFTKTFKISASVKDQALANAWVRAIGQGEAIKEMVPSQTLSSIVGEALKEGKSAPPTAIETRIIDLIARERN